MIVCPNCSHQNPDAAIQCEACYTPLPAMTTCTSCGAAVQTDASFCGQCGFNLQAAEASSLGAATEPLAAAEISQPDHSSKFSIPPLVPPDPLVGAGLSEASLLESALANASQPELPQPELSQVAAAMPEANSEASPVEPDLPPEAPSPVPVPAPGSSQTQLQTQAAQLLHVQTNTIVEIPSTLAVIHIGKPNDRIPPDVDVSGYPHSEIVSRIHADIRVEGDIYYIEDVGSSNGTYINNAPLPSGNRHRLRPGDRIALGKGDKVTFLFQIS